MGPEGELLSQVFNFSQACSLCVGKSSVCDIDLTLGHTMYVNFVTPSQKRHNPPIDVWCFNGWQRSCEIVKLKFFWMKNLFTFPFNLFIFVFIFSLKNKYFSLLCLVLIYIDPKQFWTIKIIFDWFKIFGTWFKEQKSVLKSHCQ